MRRISLPGTGMLLTVIVLFEASAFGLIAFRGETLDIQALIIGGGIIFMFLLSYNLMNHIFAGVDRYALIIVNILACLGFIMQYRLNPGTAMRQMVWYAIGTVCMFIAAAVVRRVKVETWHKLRYWLMIGGIGLLSLSYLFGKDINGAKNWFNIGGIAIQPSEFVKIMLVFVIAAVIDRSRKIVTHLPMFAFVAFAMGLLVLQTDLGAAMLYAFTFLILYYVGTSNLVITGLGLAAGAGGAVLSYKLFSHVKRRVAVWQDPWQDATGSGYQIVHGLTAIASGGILGMGLYQGTPGSIPFASTDYIFAAICEEMGILAGVCIVAFFILLTFRGAITALNARQPFYSILAFGCTTILMLQSFIIIGGVTKMIPLTGITLPFVSYGGSSMLTCMIMIGILQGINIRNADLDRADLESMGMGGEFK
jgi:cell division protein FtsW (lipid II flippase)